MIERIEKNEERFDSVLSSLKDLESSLKNFKSNKENLRLLNKYYKSKNWIKDKDVYETGKLPKVKAGVLSEDGVWNTLDDIESLLKEMEKTIKDFKRII